MPVTANMGGTSDCWVSKCKALADAFRKLPNRKESAGPGIPYDFFLSDLVRELMLMRPVPSHSSKKPTKQLRELAKLTGRALTLLDGLSQPALDALNYNRKRVTLKQLRFGLWTLHAAADLAGVPVISKPKKTQEGKIALAVAQIYHGQTGERPTVRTKDGVAYGPFLDLLRDVYEILEVAASPEDQARRVAKQWRAGKEKTHSIPSRPNSFGA
jgi:hypothetical protein